MSEIANFDMEIHLETIDRNSWEWNIVCSIWCIDAQYNPMIADPHFFLILFVLLTLISIIILTLTPDGYTNFWISKEAEDDNDEDDDDDDDDGYDHHHI